MKKALVIIPALIVAFASTQLMAGPTFKPVCHKVYLSDGTTERERPPEFILWVPEGDAYEAHIAHGDTDATVADFDRGRDKATKTKGPFSTTCEEEEG